MRKTIRAGLLAASMLSSSNLVAQTSGRGATSQVPVDAPTAQTGDQRIEDAIIPAAPGDIVITARKVEERLQDAPVAVTAFTTAEIKSARITSLADIAKLTPGLNFTPLFGRQNQLPIIRGAAQTFGQLNVGVFLDGIYLSGKAGVDLELNDLQRIEVIKGPQSALYGRNTFAGAINYVTLRPTARLTGRGEVEGGNNGYYKFQTSISGPLSEELRFRIGGYYRHFNGFYRSALDGGRVDFEKSYGGIGTLEWAPISALTITLRGSYSSDNLGQPPSSVIRNNAAPGVAAGSSIAPIPRVLPNGFQSPARNLIYIGQVPSISRDGVTVNTVTLPGQPSGYGDREAAIRGSGTLAYDFGPMTLTSITAYAKRNNEYTFDGDNTVCDQTGGCANFGFPFSPRNPVGASAYALSSNVGYSRDVSQELRFASNGRNAIDYQFGLFYYDNINYGVDRGFAALANFQGFNPNYSLPKTRLTTKSYAVFGSTTFNATDKLSVIGELRYEYEIQTFSQCPTHYSSVAGATPITCATVSPIASAAPYTFGGSTALFDLRQAFRFLTPRVIIDYKLSPDALFYASFSRGAKTGGFNTGLNIFDNQRTYQPEFSNNYEIGFKSELLDKRLLFNIAGFFIDWRDQQAACQNPITSGGTSTNRTYICNIAGARIFGTEIELVGRVGRYLSIAANYAYTDATYRAFIDDSLSQTLSVAGLPQIDFRGRRLPYVPRHKFLVSPRLTLPLSGDDRIEARADVQYQSRSFLRADNFQSFGGRTTVDLRLTAYLGALYLQAFANNVFDNSTPLAGVRFYDATNYSVASPLVTGAQRRQVGGAIGFRF